MTTGNEQPDFPPPTTSETGEQDNITATPASSNNGITYDQNDPLVWSWKRKHLALFAICYMSFMTDFLAGYGVPMIIPQAKEWKLSPADSTRSLSGNTFTQGFGSLIAVPFSQRFGILPVMFWSTFITLFMTIACALCPDDWIGFIAIRVVQGLFSTAAQVLGMTVIQDIFFFEEHVRKLGIWGWSILIGPYFGPFLSSFIVSTLKWRTAFWIVSAFVGLGIILIALLLDETSFDRINLSNNPPRPVKNWKYKLQALSGVYGYRAKGKPSLWQGCVEIWRVFNKPQFYTLFFYHGVTYMWSVGINGSLVLFLVPPPPKGYGFDSVGIGLIYFAPMIGIVLGELWGHFFNDLIQARSIRKNNGFFVPESRLWAIYFSTVFSAVGLGLLGVGLQNLWSWGIIALLWGAYIWSLMIGTVATSGEPSLVILIWLYLTTSTTIAAYVLDCFPQRSAAASALLNFTRVLHGFLVPFFQNKWANTVGANWSFGTQAIICVVAFGLVPVVQRFGKRWRERTSLSPDHIAVTMVEGQS
ncbi:major facilitator superfamily domain-containing protein [Tuber indicum]|nr:major facilitator superfamily domain-containing protein [Tuber indicum]